MAAHKAAVAEAGRDLGRNPTRFLTLLFVKTFIISQLLALSFADCAAMRLFFSVACVQVFPQSLSPRLVKKVIAEIYLATMRLFMLRLSGARKGAGGPIVHASFDLWTSKDSKEKYIGLRVHWMTAGFTLCTALLAVKLFRPAPELSDDMKLHDALCLWVKEVIAEYGMSETDLFSTVTDAGSDAKRLCLKLLDCKWEWCFPHMLNCALVEAFGTNASRASCENNQARDVIDKVERVVEHLNKCPSSKVGFGDVQTKLYGNTDEMMNAVPQRWVCTCGVLQTVLSNWSALEHHYSENESVAFPLSASEASIEELYSLMEPIAAILTDNTQSTDVPTGVMTLLEVVAIRVSLLREGSSLRIQSPRQQLVATSKVHTAPAPVIREEADLQKVTIKTKRKLAAAVDKRFFKRYDLDAPGNEPDFLFEMAASMNPFLATLPFLPSVCSTKAMADRVRAKVKKKIVDLMTRMAKECGSSPEPCAAASPRNGGANANDARPKKKKRLSGGQGHLTPTTSKAASQQAARLFESGMFGDIPMDEPVRAAPKTQRQLCEEEFDRFVVAGQEESLTSKPIRFMFQYWSSEGLQTYPLMARAARVLLSIPASSAVVERDFSTAGRLSTGYRNPLDAAYHDMVLFLHGSYADIPDEVPILSDAQALAAVPERLSNPSESTCKLSEGSVQGNGRKSGDDEFSAAQRGGEQRDNRGADR